MIRIATLFIISFSLTLLFESCNQKSGKNKNKNQKEAADKKQPDQQTVAEKAGVKLPSVPGSAPKKSEEIPAHQALDKLMEFSPASSEKLPEVSSALPDFKSIQDSKKRKKRFIEFMKPVIAGENSKILQDRYLITQLYKGVKNGDSLSKKDLEWLKSMAKTYRVKNTNFPSDEAFRQLLMHVDIIPMDLAIAQAINESAWGTSRFARIGNNMFGQWCFKKGCGVVPAQRKEGATHEVAVFKTVAGSVESYMHHVNSHPAYRQLRYLRYQQRLEGRQPDGHTIALGLQKYSAIGMKYVNILRSLMDKNSDLIES